MNTFRITTNIQPKMHLYSPDVFYMLNVNVGSVTNNRLLHEMHMQIPLIGYCLSIHFFLFFQPKNKICFFPSGSCFVLVHFSFCSLTLTNFPKKAPGLALFTLFCCVNFFFQNVTNEAIHMNVDAESWKMPIDYFHLNSLFSVLFFSPRSLPLVYCLPLSVFTETHIRSISYSQYWNVQQNFDALLIFDIANSEWIKIRKKNTQLDTCSRSQYPFEYMHRVLSQKIFL